MKIVLPESVVRQILTMMQAEPKAHQLETLEELAKIFAQMFSQDFKEAHEMQDLDTLEHEYGTTPVPADEAEDLPMPVDRDDDPPPHQFDNVNELVGFLKRRLGLTD